MNNVANDPAYREIVSELRERLLNELTTTNDPRMIDDGRFFESPPMAGPVTRGQKPKKKAQ